MSDDWQNLPRFRFGDTAALADDLLALVLAGTKTATCCAAGEELTVFSAGDRQVVLDSIGRPRAVIETEAVERRAWEDINSDFAWAEGEGDRSLAEWRTAHRRYFERNGGFRSDMMLSCERFRLVAVLPSY